jgi:hypothetical protein
MRVSRLKVSLLIVLALLSGCSWFHKGKPPVPDPTELIVNGAPVGSVLFIDGVQAGQPKEAGNRTQVVDVSPGAHTLEVRRDGSVAYRENTFVTSGKKVVITVLAGDSRN